MRSPNAANPFDAARDRLTEGKPRRRRFVRADAPDTIVPPADELSPDRLEAARTRLRLTTPPKRDDE